MTLLRSLLEGWPAATQGLLVPATLVALAALVGLSFGDRWPARLRYFVLLLALAKFVVPPGWSLPLGLFPSVPLASVVGEGRLLGSFGDAELARPTANTPAAGGATDSQAPPSADAAAEGGSTRGILSRLASLINPPDNSVPALPSATPSSADQGRSNTSSSAVRPQTESTSWLVFNRLRPWTVALLIYWLGVAGLLGFHLLQWLRWCRVCRQADPFSAVPATGIATILLSREAPAPLSFGLFKPVVLLPKEDAGSWTPSQLQVVLAHEHTHIRHRDHWINAAKLLVVILWWFHPLVWLLAARLRQAQEDCCDDAVVRSGVVERDDYCQTLLSVARSHHRTPPPAIAVSMTHPKHPLGRRFRRLLDPQLKGRTSMTWRSRILIVALAVTVLPSARRAPAEEAFVDPWANLEQVEITLQADGELEISGRSYDRDLLKKALRWRFKSQPQQEVLVYANPAAQLVTVLDVLQLVRNAGFKDVDLYSLQKNRSGHRRDDSFPEEIELVEEVEPVEIIEEVGIGATDLIEEVEVLEEAPSTVDEWAAWVAPSVRASLSWLAFSQHPEGYWDADRWGGDGAQDVGVTALAVLAFLGDGQTQRDGPHSAAVRRALHWLIDGQDERGLLQRKRSIHQMYCHAIATLALAEAYHLSSDENLREPAQEAVHAIHRARNPYRAWRYGELPDGDNDVSISGWMLIALFAARDAGLEVDRAALRDGMKYIHDMTDPRNGRTGYTSKGSPPARNVDALEQWPTEHSESMTALAMFTRILNGESPAHSIPLRQGSDLLKAKPPTWNVQTGQIDYYYWYFGLASLWQMGGPAWNLWQHNALEALIPHQHTAGDLQGSWDSHVDPWGTQGGRVYATALNSLSLQVCQRYQHLSR